MYCHIILRGLRWFQIHGLMVRHEGSSAGSYLADPTSPIPSHCAVITLFKSVPVHQLSWLALQELWMWIIMGSFVPMWMCVWRLPYFWLWVFYHKPAMYNSFLSKQWGNHNCLGTKSSSRLHHCARGNYILHELVCVVFNWRMSTNQPQ